MRTATIFARLLPYFLPLSMLLMCNYSYAVFINFDDIDRIDDPFWASQPLTTEYLAKGLLIDDGYMGSYGGAPELVVSGPNYLQGGPYFNLTFVGELPKFISMIVTSSHDDVVYLDALCGDGSILSKETPGWAGPYYNSPFAPKQLITFTSEFGISKINISAFYFLRTSAMVDDLTYYYAVPVPESNILMLLIPGLLILLLMRLKERSH